MSHRVTVLVAAALVGLSACVPSQVEEEVTTYPKDTTMHRIQRDGVLRVGIEDSLPPFSSTGASFVTSYAGFIGDSLGVDDVTVTTGTAEELLTMVRDGDIDVAFPLEPATETLVRQNALTDPYWVGHQRLLVPEGSGVRDSSDLEGRSVCSLIDHETEAPLDAIHDAIETETVTDPHACTAGLKSGRYDAATASDVFLIVMAARLGGSHIVGDELSTEGYSAAVPKGDTDMVAFINTTLGEYKSEGHWLDAYDSLLASYAALEDPHAPELTLEEVATLFPKEPGAPTN